MRPLPIKSTALAALLFIIASASGRAATYAVNSTADDGTGNCTTSKCTLRDAVLSAASNDTITFSIPAGSVITLTNGELLIDKNLTINGLGAEILTVQRSSASGTPDFRVFAIASGSRRVTISNLTISGGTRSGIDINAGGAVVKIAHCRISKNSSGPFSIGCGIKITNTTVSIINTDIADNTGPGGGGGFSVDGSTVTLTNSTVSNNTTSGDGGGILIYSTSTVSVTNSTVSNNTGGRGGGIYSGGNLTITNSTISGNSQINGFGGILSYKGFVSIFSSTVYANKGGGIINIGNGASVSLRNTIVAGNTAYDISQAVTSLGFNLIGDGSRAQITTAPGATGDQIGTSAAPLDPKLGPLQNNGGSTLTHALLLGSPAIDKGDAGDSVTDQRGLPRPVDTPTIANASDGSDIGAYEVQPDQLVGCSDINLQVSNTNDSGTGSLRSIISSACIGSTITFAAHVRGAISLASGELLLDKNLTISGPGANLLSVQRSALPGTPAFRIFEIAPASVRATISGLTITNGSIATKQGGGILNAGTLTLANDMISRNIADYSGNGGGIFNDFGVLTITGSTISDNLVGKSFGSGSGGGLFMKGGTVKITNSTISNNKASDGQGGDSGGGIFNNAGTVSILHSTIAGNTGDLGGGIRNLNGGSVTLYDTIVALNNSPNGPDLNGLVNSSGFNLIGDSSGSTISAAAFNGDQIGTSAVPIDPMLGPLQDNGGPTYTRSLLAGSPAIDAGNASDVDTDQRGFPCPIDLPNIPNIADGGDIGAFEFGSAAPTPAPTPGLVGNVSTRLPVGTGDNVLIEGFIVQGPAGSTKKIIVRAIGPSLVPFGVTDALANPTLEIHDATNAIIATNNDWKTTQVGGIITGDQSAEITASGLAPGNDLESAIIANLAPGSYTAVVQGFGNTVGTGVVDAFDLSAASLARVANFATRGLIQPGDKLMIAGFIIQNGPVRAVVRAIGPSLLAFGVSNALADTTLQITNQQGAVVVENDNWKTRPDGSSQQAELEATGLQPTNDLEAAVLINLQPGQYSALMRGKPEGTGIGVVQVYFLQ